MNKVYIVRVDNQDTYDCYMEAEIRAYLSKEEATKFIEECKAEFASDDNRWYKAYMLGMNDQDDAYISKCAEDEMCDLEVKWRNLTNGIIIPGHDNPRWSIKELDLY